ncbi:MAG TPA: hypothetical protein DCS07_18190 [Bdellovibrionales bacterium]|nr:MAG: hypothetical protein A2Z97_01895 [Bdellovibrionales bacterium GWB1_52_6]OFZ04903.1 MAG: hypothetical protein A2X97_16180 [Bdellovibrionales bacterium GWA1_52_35]OFZ40434.1 MAG: hypothetical protein A2070_02210 [Bdellovibrionales bacterium GWC1_52_8]HAR44533.1 hypothetical protein [Bdellovibrionales bacterium]HCM38835.1 hypothetical protein [Bdellovibrionales bacterium]
MLITKQIVGCILIISLGALMTSCGNQLTCAIQGDNIKGHVNFTGAVPAQAGKTIVIQYSKDNFSSVAHASTVSNLQGLISVPYSFCVDNEVDAVFRAIQDDNGNGSWESGEGSGRADTTSDGNAPYKVYNLPVAQPSATPPVPWKVESGVDIAIDSTTAQ